MDGFALALCISLYLSEDLPLQMELAFKEGIWSPETLIFMLHLSVVLSAGIASEF